MKNGLVPFGPFEQPPLWLGPRPRFEQRQPFGVPLPRIIELDQLRILRQLMPSPPTIQVQPLPIVTEPQALASDWSGMAARRIRVRAKHAANTVT
jgi:hypothetical protein